ncbi:endonuclease/exonuclease/phosphatase family protein [Anabaena sphaerica FACHB-251]|uniref:Endonuclease/exonuclease/phosphatase family protein n=1 Tax=Anabaena sphaerica FACHB-251 TaxID=2692883 RepID=A0A926WFK1_9NOST|nr:endonuclease/exonuclease/phosphatase family protein [Anabaena sphaerica]MBD2293583.1 endonuclease/exonuclease/phosphatase family protein [Anabaena sphaerica FACHB-251]
MKVITINILFKLNYWTQRRQLLVEGLRAENPDIIALQEVSLAEDTAAWIGEQLNIPYIYKAVPKEVCNSDLPFGLAILSRYPIEKTAALNLEHQGRIAQYAQVKLDDNKSIVICNGHYYWHPGSHKKRNKQIQMMLDWLSQFSDEMPIISVGDFNGTPETSGIALVKEKYQSAYEVYHGNEPEYTCPTLLGQDKISWRNRLKQFWRTLIFNMSWKPWKGTLDYIFINQHLQVRDCRVILNRPAANNRYLYPSDHFGIVADLEIVDS